ncbi:MAG: DUF3108 domain-containing protein [Gammaproteobacteria bacterium]|nr:DUF3108 domain-containing protein [Gammaproteobacteria bacterium]
MSKLMVAAAIAGLLLLGNASADESLVPHRAEYKVRISVVSGRLNTELRRTENGYVAHHVIKPTGMSKLLTRGRMDVTSEFAAAADGVKPVRFTAVDTIRDDPDVDLSFDWSSNKVTGTVGTEDVTLQLDGLAHDNVSIQYELMSDLLSGMRDERYTLFDVDKMRIADVSDAGRKRVKTKAGKFDAIGVRHQKQGSSRITTLWCVEELGYLPVIIEQHRKGKLKFRATLVEYTPTSEAST